MAMGPASSKIRPMQLDAAEARASRSIRPQAHRNIGTLVGDLNRSVDLEITARVRRVS
jgi:hypothetical protein